MTTSKYIQTKMPQGSSAILITNMPEKRPKDSDWCFFDVRHPDWVGGKWHRLKRRLRDAMRLANLVGYEVRYSDNQEQPSIDQRGTAGSQAATIYGATNKKDLK